MVHKNGHFGVQVKRDFCKRGCSFGFANQKGVLGAQTGVSPKSGLGVCGYGATRHRIEVDKSRLWFSGLFYDENSLEHLSYLVNGCAGLRRLKILRRERHKN